MNSLYSSVSNKAAAIGPMQSKFKLRLSWHLRRTRSTAGSIGKCWLQVATVSVQGLRVGQLVPLFRLRILGDFGVASRAMSRVGAGPKAY